MSRPCPPVDSRCLLQNCWCFLCCSDVASDAWLSGIWTKGTEDVFHFRLFLKRRLRLFCYLHCRSSSVSNDVPSCTLLSVALCLLSVDRDGCLHVSGDRCGRFYPNMLSASLHLVCVIVTASPAHGQDASTNTTQTNQTQHAHLSHLNVSRLYIAFPQDKAHTMAHVYCAPHLLNAFQLLFHFS